jgi:hypothetical protein
VQIKQRIKTCFDKIGHILGSRASCSYQLLITIEGICRVCNKIFTTLSKNPGD